MLTLVIPPFLSESTPRPISEMSVEEDRSLRKKSGEIVKSSLRPRLTPLKPNLTRTVSFPSGSSGKSVKFAQDLESVKLFGKSERPACISNQVSPEPEMTEDEAEDENSGLWQVVTSIFPTYNRLGNKMVFLDSMDINFSQESLIGTIYCKNISFEKRVSLRLTVDNWKTVSLLEKCSYISSNHFFSGTAEPYDRFQVEVPINALNFDFNQRKLSLEFAVQYETNHTIFWDNNENRNYQIVLSRVKQETRTHELDKEDLFESIESMLEPKLDFASNRDAKTTKKRYNFDPFAKHEINYRYFSPPADNSVRASYFDPRPAIPRHFDSFNLSLDDLTLSAIC